MIMAKARRNGGKPVRVVTDTEGQVESNSMLARIQPVGVQEDGRMYYKIGRASCRERVSSPV